MRPRRVLVYLLYLGLAGAAAAVVCEHLRNALQSYALTEELSRLDATYSLTYVLEQDSWSVFDLPAQHEGLKIIANAFTDDSLDPAEDLDVRYCVAYEIAGSGGRVLRRGSHHLRAKIQALRGEERRRRGERFRFDEPGAMPLGGRLAVMDLSGLPRSTKELRLRLESRDGALEGAVVRVYYKRRFSDAQKAFRWKRIGLEQRQRLTRYNVYSPDVLDDAERERYCEFEWVALAPRGVLNEDYEVKVLYNERPEDEEQVFDPDPPGRLVRAGRRLVLALPAGQHRVALEIARPAEAAAPMPPALVDVCWQGGEPRRSRSFTLHVEEEEASLEGWFDGGLLDVAPSEDVFVRSFLEFGAAREEIFPCDLLVRAFLCDRGEPLILALDGGGDGGVPYRIDVRRMLPPRGEAPEEESALYDVRVRQRCGPAGSGGDGDRPEAEMVLAGCVDVSPYAELAGDEAQRITGAARHYILASPGVREIEIRSEIDATLIAIYNRLDALPRQVRLPAPSDPCERGGWDWFPRYPDNTAQWEARRKLRSLRIQPAPPADAAGGEPRYSLWRRVAPVWPRETLDLLVPWIRAPGGERPAAGDYLELPLGREETVRVAGGAGAAEARPRIIALDPFGGGGELSAEVDRRIVFSTELRGRVGLFRLPSVPSGIHSLRVDAPEGVRVFASGLSSEDGPAYRRLSATPIGGGRVSCDVIKESAGEEMLIARVFLEESVQGPVDLCAEIRLLEPKGEGPFQSWTFLRHQVSLEPAGEAGAFLLRREGIALREAEPLTIELGEDLPPGLYRVEFHFSAAARGCVRLSQGRKEPRPFGSVTRMVSLERGDEPEIDGDG